MVSFSPWIWSRNIMNSKSYKVKLAQTVTGHLLGIRVQQEALCGRRSGCSLAYLQIPLSGVAPSSEMDAVWGGNSGRKPGSMWVWVLPQGKRGIVYSSSRKRAGSPLGLGHLFPTNRLFTEKHDFCWPERMLGFNPHLQSCLSCLFFLSPEVDAYKFISSGLGVSLWLGMASPVTQKAESSLKMCKTQLQLYISSEDISTHQSNQCSNWPYHHALGQGFLQSLPPIAHRLLQSDRSRTWSNNTSPERGVLGYVYKQNLWKQWGRGSQQISALATGSFHKYRLSKDGISAYGLWVFTEESRHL